MFVRAGALIVFVALAGTSVLASRGAPESTNISQAGTGLLTLSIAVPSAETVLRSPRAHTNSANARAIVVAVAPQIGVGSSAETFLGTFDVSPESAACLPTRFGRSCQFSVRAPAGRDIVSVDVLDKSDATAVPAPHRLGSATVAQTIDADRVNAAAFIVGGVRAALVVTPEAIAFTGRDGGAHPAAVYVSARDAADATIIGSDQDARAVRVKIEGSDTQHDVGIVGSPNPRATTLDASSLGRPVLLSYSARDASGPVSVQVTAEGIDGAKALVYRESVSDVTPKQEALAHSAP